MTSPWWLGHSPARAEIECSGEVHHLRWCDGSLAALDHDDVLGERALAAIGAQRLACIDVQDMWARHSSDVRVLSLASRGASDLLTHRPHTLGLQAGGPTRWPAPSAAGFTARTLGVNMSGYRRFVATSAVGTVSGPFASPSDHDELLRLLSLGGIADRLALTVAAAWSDRLAAGAPGAPYPALVAALYGRATAAIRAWLGEPDLVVHLDMVDGEQPRLNRTDTGLRAALPFSWITDVWARGLAVILGRFALSAGHTDAGLVLRTVSPDLDDGRPVTISLGADGDDALA